jgi:hypothetical protein
MALYRKKPIVIYAFEFEGTYMSYARILATYWGERETTSAIQWVDATQTLLIETLEGNHIAQKGDMIICGVKGEFYPCKPDIFALTYEKVTS